MTNDARSIATSMLNADARSIATSMCTADATQRNARITTYLSTNSPTSVTRAGGTPKTAVEPVVQPSVGGGAASVQAGSDLGDRGYCKVVERDDGEVEIHRPSCDGWLYCCHGGPWPSNLRLAHLLVEDGLGP